MEKTLQLNNLFEEWKKQKFLFCEDGIICENVYNEIKGLKPLFILKDTNNKTTQSDELSEDGINIDMRKSIFKPGQDRTWKPVAYWTEALTSLHPQTFKDIKNISTDDCLKKTAFLNIKKDEGGSSVCGSILKKYAERDKDFLRDQIAICNPDVIITCGEDVFSCIEIIYSEAEKPTFIKKIELTNHLNTNDYGSIYKLKINSDKYVLLLRYVHPNRTSHENTYNDMLKFRDFVCHYEY